jgi:hypothetical protein
MLKLKAHSGFHDLFLKYITLQFKPFITKFNLEWYLSVSFLEEIAFVR